MNYERSPSVTHLNPKQNNYSFGSIGMIEKAMSTGKYPFLLLDDDINSILDFPNEFKPNKMYLLENNYRSSKEIVEFFQAIIKKNTNQYEKNVVSSNPNAGIKPIIVSFENNKLRDPPDE